MIHHRLRRAWLHPERALDAGTIEGMPTESEGRERLRAILVATPLRVNEYIELLRLEDGEETDTLVRQEYPGRS